MDKTMLDKYIYLSKELNELNNTMVKENKNLQLKKAVNGIVCTECNTAAFTFSQNDFNKCNCGKNGIDGGLSSSFRIIGETNKWIPLFIIQNKKERKRNKIVYDKTMELRSLVQEMKKELIN